MSALICVVRKISHSQWLHGKQTCFYSSVVPSLICLLMETSLPAGRHPLSLAAPHTSTRPDLKGFTIKDSCMYVWYTTPSGFYNNIPSYFHKTRPQGLHNNGLSHVCIVYHSIRVLQYHTIILPQHQTPRAPQSTIIDSCIPQHQSFTMSYHHTSTGASQ